MNGEVLGNIKGIRNSVLENLKTLYDFSVDKSQIISKELCLKMVNITAIINREVCVYLNRNGQVVSVGVGDSNTVSLPDLSNQRSESSLSGIRCLHTHPNGDAHLSNIDLSALKLNFFDVMIAVGVNTIPEKSQCCFAFLSNIFPDGGYQVSVYDPVALEEAENIFFPNLLKVLEKNLNKNSITDLSNKRERAIVVSLEYNGMNTVEGWNSEDSLEELKQLADTAGAVVVGRFLQKRPKPDPAFFIGKGKVRELALYVQEQDVDLCIFDDELSPAQQRNIEEALGIHVVDRTGLILDIFAQRARTNEGKLQVELAQLQYMLPRIMGQGLSLSRLGGGIGTRGAGETKLELDRRHIRDRISYIKDCIGKVKTVRDLHRSGRTKAEIPTISLVGYTNAGKSTLLNVLTNSDIYAKDQLFATLDPTSRQLILPDKREVVLTDTVGFIQRLPHQLVASFQSTLEDTINADLLLHVIDVSHELYQEQSNAVYRVLEEIKANDKIIITVFNKVDKLPKKSLLLDRLQQQENVVCISAKKRLNLDKLLFMISEKLKLQIVEGDFYIPYEESGLVAKLHELGTVVTEEYLSDYTKVHAIVENKFVKQFEQYFKNERLK